MTRLPTFCERHGATLYDQAQHLVHLAVKKAEFARDWRNRRISQSDLATAVGTAEPLTPASLQNVTGALDAVHTVLNTISKELLNAEIGNIVASASRARAFLSYARQLVDSVEFIDAVVDPDRTAQITDTVVATSFLERLGLKPTMENVRCVMELREAAGRFA